MTCRIAVVGGGLGGLLAAAALRNDGHDVTVFEAGDAVGGVARTMSEDGYLVEPAAATFTLPHPALSAMLEAAGVDVAPLEAASRRLLWDGTTLHDVPTSPKAAVRTSLVSSAAKLRALAEMVVRSSSPDGETLQGFMLRRFGRGVGTLAAHLAATGVFGGDPVRIEAAAFPQLLAIEEASGSLLRGMASRRRSDGDSPRPAVHVPTGGMADLADTVAAYVGDVRTGSPVRRIRTGHPHPVVIDDAGESNWDGVVLAVSGELVGRLLGIATPQDPPTVDVAVVALGGAAAHMGLPDAFGVLTGPGCDTPVLGVLVESAQGRTPAGHALARALVGGARRPDVAGWGDDRLAVVVIEDVGRMLGHHIDPSFVKIVRRRIPQYAVGHRRSVAQITRALPPGMVVAGWWHGGMGVGSLATDAGRIAASFRNGSSGDGMSGHQW